MAIQLFISHAWRYSEHYEKIVTWLDESRILYVNHSVTKENPLHSGNRERLERDLFYQIEPADTIIILAGMYAAHSDWIEYEINVATYMKKYIIGVEPWGQERTPHIIKENSDKIVGWNSKSVIDAISNHQAYLALRRGLRL